MMKIISQLPSFEKEKEYRCYSEGNENLNYIKIDNNRKQTESNLDSWKKKLLKYK